MQAEKLYSKIRESLDNDDFTPEWSKNDVWQRIDQGKNKKVFSLWWQAAAASVVLVSLFGGYLLVNDSSDATYQTLKKDAPAKSSPKSVANTTNSLAAISPTPLAVAGKTSRTKRVNSGAMHTMPMESIVETERTDEEFDNIVMTEDGEQEISYENVTSKNEPAVEQPMRFDIPIIFRPKAVEKTAPGKRERVAILEIPEGEADFLIAPKEKKRNRESRLAKQASKPTNTETAEANKSNKIWAFVKESFKNETISPDSTIK